MTPVALTSRSLLVRAPAAYVVALAARTLQRPVFPPQRMDIRLALFSVEEVVQMREYQHRFCRKFSFEAICGMVSPSNPCCQGGERRWRSASKGPISLKI